MPNRRDFIRASVATTGVTTFAGLNAPVVGEVPMPEDSRLQLERIPAERPIRVGAILFPKMDQIDLTGPFEVLSRLPNATFQICGKDRTPIRDIKGLILTPDAAFEEMRPLDLLIVPGGPGQEQLMEDEVVLDFIRKQADCAKCVFSACTGALICGAAGLLKGRRATTHWGSFHLLEYFGAIPVDRRVVEDGTLVSAAGVTAGIDGALRVAAILRGDDAARRIQLDIQYSPEPPFDCGLPSKAPAAILSDARDATRKLAEARLATAKRFATEHNIRVEK